MSLILDALKKAENERNTGIVRNVPMPPAFSSYRQQQSAWRKPWPWIVLAAAVIAMGAAIWSGVTRNEAPVALRQEAPAAVKPATHADVPREAEKMTEAVPAEPQPARQKEKVIKKPAEKKRTPAAGETKLTQAATPEPPIPTLRELPEQIQREIPTLAISGYIYSGNKADRTVLINKRLLREGDEAAPGLTLEKMTPNGMVLNYKGYRYRAGY
jgi:general secretion pathway protein B